MAADQEFAWQSRGKKNPVNNAGLCFTRENSANYKTKPMTPKCNASGRGFLDQFPFLSVIER